MPLYEYECPTCQAIKEVLHPYPYNSLPCPDCQSEMKRVVSKISRTATAWR